MAAKRPRRLLRELTLQTLLSPNIMRVWLQDRGSFFVPRRAPPKHAPDLRGAPRLCGTRPRGSGGGRRCAEQPPPRRQRLFSATEKLIPSERATRAFPVSRAAREKMIFPHQLYITRNNRTDVKGRVNFSCSKRRSISERKCLPLRLELAFFLLPSLAKDLTFSLP